MQKIIMTNNITLLIPVSCLSGIWEGKWQDLPPNQVYQLIIDYPFEIPVKFQIKTGKYGMGIIKLLKVIGQKYEEAFKNEDKYGNTGHDLDDLSLEGLKINHKKKKIELFMGS